MQREGRYRRHQGLTGMQTTTHAFGLAKKGKDDVIPACDFRLDFTKEVD